MLLKISCGCWVLDFLAPVASINLSQGSYVLLLKLFELKVQAVQLNELCGTIFKSRSTLQCSWVYCVPLGSCCSSAEDNDRKQSSSSFIVNQFSSVAQSCLTLCDRMDCSSPGFPICHQLLELAQTHVHQIGDAIQPSHLMSPFPPAVNLSQPQGVSQWVSSSHQVAKVLELQLQHQSFQ